MRTLSFVVHIRYYSLKNMGTAFFYWFADLFFRLQSKYLRMTGKILEFSSHESKSDSELRPYLHFIELAAAEPEVGNKFRREFKYREILEHVGYFLGAKYLQELNGFEDFDIHQLKRNSANDTYGNPRTFTLFNDLKLSTTTIRYLVVWHQIQSFLKPTENSKWVEIGCGYGGQAAVINRMISIQSYTMFDVPQAEKLITQYLREIDSKLSPIFGNLDDVQSDQTYDFAISNYAFSELPKKVQTKYLTNVLTRSRHGYMIMNSGQSNLSGRSNGKLSLSEIQSFLPSLKVIQEKPITGPDNYIIIW